MSNGVLSFTLGLEASSFLRGIGLASGQIISLAGVMQGLQAPVRGAWSAIERGGQLTDLSNRTGESVRNIYQLQEAFRVVGISGDAVAPMLLRMQRAMSGIDEAGNRTDDLFAEIGLSFEDLKKMQAPQQIQAIATALAGMPKEEAAGLASRLFGREGFGNIMQIARDMKGFNDSLGGTAGAADVVARTAAAFDQIGDTIAVIKSQVGGMFAGIAEGAAPALQAIMDFVSGIDWVAIGTNIGTVLNGLTQAFKLGELGGLLMDTFRAAFDSMPALAMAGIQKLGVLLLKVIQTPLTYLQAGFDYAIDQIIANPKVRAILAAATGGSSERTLNALGVGPGGQGMTFGQAWEERKQRGLEFFMPGMDLGGLDASANANMTAAVEQFKRSFGGVWERIQELGTSGFKAEMIAPGTGAGGGGLNLGGRAGRAGKNEVSEWEKMGYVMRGGTAGSDHAKATADHTRTMTGLMRQSNRLLADLKSGGLSFANT